MLTIGSLAGSKAKLSEGLDILDTGTVIYFQVHFVSAFKNFIKMHKKLNRPSDNI
jgi:hypothetical protein